MAQNNIPWKIISKPGISNKPIKPNIPQNLIFGFFSSFLIGALVAAIRDQLDNKFNFPDEVKNSLNYPFLGICLMLIFFKN